MPVIAYDRPIPGTPADYYISFDNEKIGKSIGDDLVKHLKETGAQGGSSKSTDRRRTLPRG